MDGAFPGLGTLINVVTVVVGALLGMAVGHRLPERTRSVVTDCLGLVTLLIAGLSAVERDRPGRWPRRSAPGAPVLIVLGSLLIGGIVGSLLRIEERLEGLAGRDPGPARPAADARRRRGDRARTTGARAVHRGVADARRCCSASAR